MTQNFRIKRQTMLPGTVLFSLGIHILIFSNFIFTVPRSTDHQQPVLAFLGSVLTEQDFSPHTKPPAIRQKLPSDFAQNSKGLLDRQTLNKPNYSSDLDHGSKSDFKPPVTALNPKDAEREEKAEKDLGIDLQAPPRPSLKLYKQ